MPIVFAYALRRIFTTVPLVVAATFLVFVLVSISGNPLARLATCATCSQAAYQRLIDLYDLDQPIPVRYLGWVADAATGDFGTAVSLGEQPVNAILAERLWNTALLAVPAFLLIAVEGHMVACHFPIAPGETLIERVRQLGRAADVLG